MDDLIKKAKELRKKVIRLVFERKEGHLGGGLSEIEILIALYNRILKEEDKFILSKGHACYPLYFLLKEKGYNPKIRAHPDRDDENGIPATTGSLGHGLPIAVGMALARKLKGQSGNIYVLMGDGECQEGTVWESMLVAAHHKLDNLTIIIDHNKFQYFGDIKKICSLGDLKKKFEAFDGQVEEINGHSFEEIMSALQKFNFNKPKIIIAHTTKGKGVSFMENSAIWHGKVPTEEELNFAYKELE